MPSIIHPVIILALKLFHVKISEIEGDTALSLFSYCDYELNPFYFAPANIAKLSPSYGRGLSAFLLTLAIGLFLSGSDLWESALMIAIVTGILTLLTEVIKAWISRKKESDEK